MERINFNISNNNKYNLTKILIDSEDLDVSDSDNEIPYSKIPTIATSITAAATFYHFANFMSKIALYQKGESDNLDKLCTPGIGSKSTRVVR